MCGLYANKKSTRIQKWRVKSIFALTIIVGFNFQDADITTICEHDRLRSASPIARGEPTSASAILDRYVASISGGGSDKMQPPSPVVAIAEVEADDDDDDDNDEEREESASCASPARVTSEERSTKTPLDDARPSSAATASATTTPSDDYEKEHARLSLAHDRARLRLVERQLAYEAELHALRLDVERARLQHERARLQYEEARLKQLRDFR